VATLPAHVARLPSRPSSSLSWGFFQYVAPTKTALAAIFNEVKTEAILKRHLVKWLQSLDHDSRRSYKFLFESRRPSHFMAYSVSIMHFGSDEAIEKAMPSMFSGRYFLLVYSCCLLSYLLNYN